MILIMYVLNNVYVYVICIYVSFKMFNVFFTEIDGCGPVKPWTRKKMSPKE